ncbi:MAG: thermonuclease family protein [Desulfobacterales bacterium]
MKKPSIQMRRHKKIYPIAPVIFILLMAAGYAPAQTWYTVKWVEDGDTIVLNTGERIRYLGINAPEIDHEDSKAQPYGYQARSFNKKLLMRSKIRLEFDAERWDQYGRMLAYIFRPDGVFVNLRLLENGLAFYLYRLPNVSLLTIQLNQPFNSINTSTFFIQ